MTLPIIVLWVGVNMAFAILLATGLAIFFYGQKKESVFYRSVGGAFVILVSIALFHFMTIP